MFSWIYLQSNGHCETKNVSIEGFKSNSSSCRKFWVQKPHSWNVLSSEERRTSFPNKRSNGKNVIHLPKHSHFNECGRSNSIIFFEKTLKLIINCHTQDNNQILLKNSCFKRSFASALCDGSIAKLYFKRS